MFFGKKKSIKCKNCNSEIEEKFSFCPYCSLSLINKEKEMKDFGLLGRNNSPELNEDPLADLGFSGKMLNSLMKSMMKSLNNEFKNLPTDMENLGNAHVEQLPNGIKIKIGMPMQKPAAAKPKQQRRAGITESQMERMSKLPRGEAKTKLRRLSDKVIYEIAASGIESPNDVLISKLETGYEIKVIGKRKVYINTIPVSLPMRGFSFDDKTLFVEFKTEK